MNRFISSFEYNNNTYHYCDLKKVFQYYPILKKLPKCLKILLETNITNANENKIDEVINTFIIRDNLNEINFYPNRIIMEDFAGIPALVDFASMQEEVLISSQNQKQINPKIMVDLVIDNSLNSNNRNRRNTVSSNVKNEINANKERYKFAKWAEYKFKNFSVIPSGSALCHQVNLEYLSTMLSVKQIEDKVFIFPETIVGTNNDTTMINSLGVLGWGVSTIEIESLMLGSNLSLNLPEVVGIEITGSLAQGVSIIDAVLTLSNILKEYKLSGKFVEFYGKGLRHISVEDRAILSNIVPQYNAICGYFGVDDNTISFVEQTRGVDASLIKDYYIKQSMFDCFETLDYDKYIKFDLSLIKPLVAGPKTFQDKICVKEVASKLESFKKGNFIKDNDIVLATINSCASSSNPTVLIQAALLAKKACLLGLKINSNIKRVFKIDSLIVKEYLLKLDLLKYLEQLGFEIEEYCNTTTYENSNELVQRVSLDIEKFNLNTASLISANQNNEIKSHPLVKSNWLMSPALLIAYCIKGNMNFDITIESLHQDIFLSDIWPSMNEVNEYLEKLDYKVYKEVYKNIFIGDETWQNIEYKETNTYLWDENSTYIQASHIFEEKNLEKIEINNAKIMALFDDNITSEQLAPQGAIAPYSCCASYLQSKGLKPDEFNSFENRSANEEVMIRGTLSNSKLKNKIVSPKEGGYTKDFQSSEIMSFYDFSLKMKKENTPLVIFAGDNFGIGKLRDWAVKGIKQLGVQAIVAKSFSKEYKTSLISMGILPLEFIDDDIKSLNLKGNELISIKTENIKIDQKIQIEIKRKDEVFKVTVLSCLNTIEQIQYYKNGGILSYLLKNTF
ncbi:aconitate hydratase AcnA [Poseidonibacter sp.]|uniref:aconitate hydratase AcnA n=1 Tax=Poseidonibacter sp. TaxID=2321188 RepID=UPI003C748A29